MLQQLKARAQELRGRLGNAMNVARGQLPIVPISALSPYEVVGRWHTGSKFEGGFGPTELLTTDYWTLRARSAQLFKQNLYARGLIRRLVTNEIAVGLHLEATPVTRILGRPEDSLTEWAEEVETRFALWQADPWLCDHFELQTFGALQALARMEALIDGDVLVVLRQFQPTQLPRVQLINGSAVQSPGLGVPDLAKGHRVEHGVELDSLGRQVGYWVRQRDGTTKRLPAYGEKSGRRLAWLVYGTDRRLDQVRGEPLLSIVLQSLREIDRYRDSTQRKAVINSMLSAFVTRSQTSVTPSRPISGGAVRRGIVEAPGDGPSAAPRAYHAAELIPGMVIDELAPGEEVKAFPSTGTDEKFGEFEEAIIQAVAWVHEVPPEILRLAFSSNYSASQAAINEFKIYLNKTRTKWGDDFCTPIYTEWLLASVLTQKVAAPGLIEAWRDSTKFDTFSAWTSCDWSGNIKPSVDMSKLVKGYEGLIAMGAITRDRAARELTGTKFTQNVKKLRIENEALVRANEPLKSLDAKFAAAEQTEGGDSDPPEDTEEDATAPLRVVS
jgi:lambda family phage portal protein